MSQIPGAAAAAAAAQAWLVEKGELIALFGESIFYGAHVITCGLCLRELLLSRDMKWKFPGSIHWTMLSGALFLIFLSTFHLALGLRYNLNAIKVYLGIPGANLAFFDLAYWETIMQSVIYVTETILADALLIYRAHIVWDKSWRIVVLPLLLWFATTAIGCTTLWMVASTQHVVPSEAQRRLEHWMDGFLSITFTVNILCTSLIVHKIWRVNTQVASSALHPARLTHIVRVVIDSGLIYTACIIALFGSTLANSATQFLFSSVLVQVIGIAFNLIIIRVRRGTAMTPNSVFSTSEIGGIPLHLVRGSQPQDSQDSQRRGTIQIKDVVLGHVDKAGHADIRSKEPSRITEDFGV